MKLIISYWSAKFQNFTEVGVRDPQKPLCRHYRVFPRPFTHWGGGGICPPHMGRTSAGEQSVNEGIHEGGDIDLMGGT